MDRKTFWQLIEQTRPAGGDRGEHAAALTGRLAELPNREIPSFDRLFTTYFWRAYRGDLWGVLAVIDGGCGDDSFAYFRWWLIMQGRDVFDTVLASPDYLAEITLQDCVMCHEPFGRMAADAWERQTGGEELPAYDPGGPIPLRGRLLDEGGVREHFPALWRLLHDPPPIDPVWLSWQGGALLRLARAIEQERRWADLPVLADALEEAGCGERLILDHCRAAGRHARTCWVINFLTGRR
jgi:hypothetical protein